MDAPTATTTTEVVDFLNTLDIDGDRDDLADVEAFGSWLADRTAGHGRAAATATSLERARRLRDALRRLARANHDGDVDREALEALDALSHDLGLRPRFEPAGVTIACDVEGTDGVLGRLLADVATAMRDGAWTRVKLCADDACAWAFVDASRNRSGRWCSMAGCGNRAKVRAYRSRGAQAPQV
ncbi:MAG TPA: CGNR zinc finger domain-containing protein [Egicoccus sp.]|nr:CGNR zinc finger domain-containing protein [Egicoccus sp.]HSK25079.1 CGNR zinc finger domain-containing protein [Egicoccus sp.]